METTYPYNLILNDRLHALELFVENHPLWCNKNRSYGEDIFQEEVRCMGLRMIRDGLDREGENLILDFTRKYYPEALQYEMIWGAKMMRYLSTLTETLVENLLAEGYIALQGNTLPGYENTLFFPIKSIEEAEEFLTSLSLTTIQPLKEFLGHRKLSGWLYFKSGQLEIPKRSRSFATHASP